MKELYDNIIKKVNLRENLIEMKKLLKTEQGRKQLSSVAQGNLDFLMRLLVEQDPKVRKNAAEILGKMHCQDALDVLFDAYEAEETLFIRADYVRAMAAMDCREYLGEFRKRLEDLRKQDVPVEAKKHTDAEIRALQELLLDKEGLRKHTFSGYHCRNEVILTTKKVFADLTAQQIHTPVVRIGGGLRTETEDLLELMKIRTFREVLFVIHGCKNVPADGAQAARVLGQSDMMEIIEKNHEQPGPFYFRVGIAGEVPSEEKSRLAKETAVCLEQQMQGKLINSASHYEIELRLIRNKDGSFFPCLKFFTLPDHRFAYRRYHISAGMQPYIAAGMLKLGQAYMKEHPQVLDPFCGTGTLLIERNYLSPARSSYGTDIFGEAIAKGRANAAAAGMTIHFINRDFGDFRHDYLFDEILTDMPDKGSMAYEDLEKIYKMFFDQSSQLLNSDGIIVMYAREPGYVKKQLRFHPEFHLEQEYWVSKKNKICIFIISRNK